MEAENNNESIIELDNAAKQVDLLNGSFENITLLNSSNAEKTKTINLLDTAIDIPTSDNEKILGM